MFAVNPWCGAGVVLSPTRSESLSSERRSRVEIGRPIRRSRNLDHQCQGLSGGSLPEALSEEISWWTPMGNIISSRDSRGISISIAPSLGNELHATLPGLILALPSVPLSPCAFLHCSKWGEQGQGRHDTLRGFMDQSRLGDSSRAGVFPPCSNTTPQVLSLSTSFQSWVVEDVIDHCQPRSVQSAHQVWASPGFCAS